MIMRTAPDLPRILIIDDLYGREVGGVNEDRLALCAHLRLQDESSCVTPLRLDRPIARAVFCRAQLPIAARLGDVVENDLAGALRVLDEGWHDRPAGTPPWALVLLDLRFRSGPVTAESERRFGAGMPEGRPEDEASSSFFGLRLLEELQRHYPQLPVIVLSDAPRQAVSFQSALLGAAAFLAKGDASAPEKLTDYLHRHALLPDSSGEVVGNSVALLVALRNARRHAIGSESLLIRGEMGTGKELLARYIHRNDPHRVSAPLIVVDSGTLNPNLYTSELFGHARGAFTNAIGERAGHIVDANHGILFLDEIGNIDAVVQRGLLRVLQEKQVRPVGGNRTREIDVRFIFATNEDIEARAAAADGFRQDLLERIRQGGTIVLPPLREREEDLPLLVEALVRDAERNTPRAVRRHVDALAIERIRQYSWPGNIRQLRACVLHAVQSRPDVEHLVPIHLNVPDTNQRAMPVETTGAHFDFDAPDVAALIELLRRFDPESPSVRDLVGGYSNLEAAFASASMRYLRACIERVRKPTLRNPSGEVLVQPAMRLMTGDARLNATQAYDRVIQLRNLSRTLATVWDADSILGPLFERARAQRRARRGDEALQERPKESSHG